MRMLIRAIASCTGKQRFDTINQARAVARAQNRRKDVRIIAYPCEHCGGFHVGFAKQRRYRREGMRRRLLEDAAVE